MNETDEQEGETPERWAERMLALIEGYKAPVSEFQVGALLVSRKTLRRATVAFSCPHYTVLDFGSSRHCLSTSHVIKHYHQV